MLGGAPRRGYFCTMKAESGLLISNYRWGQCRLFPPTLVLLCASCLVNPHEPGFALNKPALFLTPPLLMKVSLHKRCKYRLSSRSLDHTNNPFDKNHFMMHV